jgi:hypothetical protein
MEVNIIKRCSQGNHNLDFLKNVLILALNVPYLGKALNPGQTETVGHLIYRPIFLDN